MRVTWLVPDVYGFLLDEIEALRSHVESLRVLSGSPVSDAVRGRFPEVEFFDCPEHRLLPWGRLSGIFRHLIAIHGWHRVLRSGWHTRKIAGMYEVLLELEKQCPSDILHSHFAHPGGLGGRLCPKAAQVLTLRGYDILTTGGYGSLWNPFFRANLIQTFGAGVPVTCGSRFSAQRARQILGADADIRYLRQGRPSMSFRLAEKHSRSSLGIPEDAAVVMSAGNLVGVKNPMLLLRAFARLSVRSERRLYLLVCGDGPLAQPLNDCAASLGISDHVRFLGRLPREELSDIYELSDIFAHTSMSEGFGNVIPEAMLHRLIVVASPVGVSPELIQHGKNGFLPELGDLESWVSGLEGAVSRIESFSAEAEVNRKTVIERHSMTKRIDGFLKIYEGELRKSSGPEFGEA